MRENVYGYIAVCRSQGLTMSTGPGFYPLKIQAFYHQDIF